MKRNLKDAIGFLERYAREFPKDAHMFYLVRDLLLEYDEQKESALDEYSSMAINNACRIDSLEKKVAALLDSVLPRDKESGE